MSDRQYRTKESQQDAQGNDPIDNLRPSARKQAADETRSEIDRDSSHHHHAAELPAGPEPIRQLSPTSVDADGHGSQGS